VIVSCPACATRFSLDASLLGPNGRNVRCAKCGHRWRQEAPAVAAESTSFATGLPGGDISAPAGEAAMPPMAPGLAALLGGRDAAKSSTSSPAAMAVPPKLRPERPARRNGMWPWVLVAGIVCGLLVAVYFLQTPITRVIPQAGKIYAWLGLGKLDPTVALKIGNLKSEQRSGLTSVRGDIFNEAETPLKIPPLLLIALDATGNPLGKGYMFRTQETDIAPGETVTFRILYQDAPKGMKSFKVTFGSVSAKEP
jgi:predicted Zn finger-like uncharacterized protein